MRKIYFRKSVSISLAFGPTSGPHEDRAANESLISSEVQSGGFELLITENEKELRSPNVLTRMGRQRSFRCCAEQGTALSGRLGSEGVNLTLVRFDPHTALGRRQVP